MKPMQTKCSCKRLNLRFACPWCSALPPWIVSRTNLGQMPNNNALPSSFKAREFKPEGA